MTQTQQNKINYGLSNVNVAPINVLADTYSYGDFFKLDGAVSLAITPTEELIQIAADDNATYFQASISNGYDGTLSIITESKKFLTEILGMIEIDGVMYESAEIKEAKAFALAFEFKGDKTPKRHVLYNVTSGRYAISSNTKSGTTIEQITIELTIAARPHPDTMLVKADVLKANNETVYNAWYDAVHQKPTEPVTPTV